MTKPNGPARESERILADVERLAGFGHYVLDVRTGTWTSSEALDRIFGIGPDFRRDIESWARLIHPDHRDEMTRYFAEEVVGRRQRFEREYRIARHSDGEERWVFGTGQLEFDDDGNVVRMLGAIQDVSDRRRAEQTLRDSEERFKYIFDRSVVGKSITLPTGELQVNQAFADLLGYTREELQKMRWQDVSHPDDLALTQRAVEPLLSGERESARFVKRYLARGGAVVWADVSTALRRDRDGRPLYFLTVVVDITERKRAELEREALLEIMQGLVSLPDPDAFLRLVHQVLSRVVFARNFFVLLREPRSGGFDFAYFVDEHDRPLPPADLGRSCSAYVFRTGESLLITEAVFDDLEARGEVTRIGTPSPSWLGAPLKRGEKTIGVLAVQDYETSGRYSEPDRAFLASVAAQVAVALERKRAEDEVRRLNADLESRVQARTSELEAALREMEAFSYSVAHDLRAPIRAIHGFSSLLDEGYGGVMDEEGRRLLATVARSAQRMGLLIDDLLEFSRIGRAEMRTSSLDLTALASLVLDEVVPAFERARYTVRVADLPPARADSRLVEIVLRNLISNAVKFSARRERAVVEVGSRETDGVVAYYVKDNGVGFDQKYATKVFGVFQRLHGVDDFGGTGIGLALVQRIVERHGGRVWAEGEKDRGATFWFTLGPAVTGRGSPAPS